MKMPSRRVAAGTSAVALVAGAVLLGASAASAAPDLDDDDIYSAPVVWNSVSPTTGVITDAYFHTADPDVEGWTGDLFDGFGYVEAYACDGWLPVRPAPAPSIPVENADGSTTLEIPLTIDPDCDASAVITASYTFHGSFARLSYTWTGAISLLAVDGDLGSDGDGTWEPVGDGMLLESDRDRSDPTVLFQIVGDGDLSAEYADDDDDFRFVSTGGTTMSIGLALADYADDEAAQAESRAMLLAVADEFDSRFGEELPTSFGDARPSVEGVTGTVGTALDVPVAYTLPAAFDEGGELDWYFGTDNDPFGSSVSSLPAGVEVEVTVGDDGRPLLRLYGTPLEAGSFSIPVWIHLEDADDLDEGEEPYRYYPLPFTFSFDVAAAPVVSTGGTPVTLVTPQAELAATGGDAAATASVAGLGGALLLAGGAIILARRRRSAIR